MNAIPFSIYIPRMSTMHNEDSVKRIMILAGVGVVSRVDFTPIDKKPGFRENVDSFVKSAFIHFADTTTIPEIEFDIYNYEFWERVTTGKHCKIQVSQKEYWICLKNNNPVKDTLMNIHQVAENGRHLEKLIEEQANTIKQQEKMINELSDALDRVKSVVYQLVGGVYCQKTQGEVVNENCNLLYPSPGCYEVPYEGPDTSKWTIWPTTRQGDDCERRIKALERMLYNDKEELDTELLARKHRSYHCDDDSSIDSALVEEAIENQLKQQEEWIEEQRYADMQEEAAADRASDMDRDSWYGMRW
jgi:hypothetical protein